MDTLYLVALSAYTSVFFLNWVIALVVAIPAPQAVMLLEPLGESVLDAVFLDVFSRTLVTRSHELGVLY
ncbi:hypothetical protein LC653_08610 [Nostoc sp. CHAB 5784]|uniref:hypothetical protein n=1 Tax=Nostoc mirabile TaxID=2907820 RepID=UPI001E633947|nr:hypothetical protein [Nostoc mirabile]MCC5663979.1 hypothetical protein [Nostoc mirabile CHAB5784]